jgi:hypothetical protein
MIQSSGARGKGEQQERRPDRFLVFSVTLWSLLLLLAGAYFLAGRSLLSRAYEDEASEVWLSRVLERADGMVSAALAITATLYALVVLVRLWNRHRRRAWIAALGLLGFYAGVETITAPFLETACALGDLYIVRDPDHWPDTRPAHYEGMGGMNSDWVRTPLERADFAEEGLNIIFIGDSFTFGFDVPSENAFPALVGEELGVRVANFGWVSSSPILSLRRLKHLGAAYHPDMVVLSIDMTDLHDDVMFANMLERRGIYRLYDRIPLTLKALRTFAPSTFWRIHSWSLNDMPRRRFFATEQPLDASRPHLESIKASILATADYCAENGWRFVLFILPRGYQYSDKETPNNWEKDEYEELGPYCLEPFVYFEELATEVDFPVHSLLDAFRDSDVFPTCFAGDPHWNAAGHRIAADAISDWLRPEVEAR